MRAQLDCSTSLDENNKITTFTFLSDLAFLCIEPPEASKMLSLAIFIFIVAVPTVVNAVDLDTCNANLQEKLANNSISPSDPIFYFDGTTYYSQAPNIRLTIDGCRANCPNPDSDIYEDAWPRLLTWLVPVLLLIGNIYIPKVGGVLNKTAAIMHYIGDPIDSMWSLLTKGEVWNRLYSIALQHTPKGEDQEKRAKALATIYAAFEELSGDMDTAQREVKELATSKGSKFSVDDIRYITFETADELVDTKVHNTPRAILVMINYIWTVVAALVPSIGGEQTSQPGGRIGTAMFLAWLLTAVLLSNTVSGFNTRRTCLRIMERYVRTIQDNGIKDWHFFTKSPRMNRTTKWKLTKGQTPGTPDFFFESQPWNGAVYSYRPNKKLLSSGEKRDKGPVFLLLLAMAPVLLAATAAFVIIYYTPNVGLGCRTVWVLSMTSVYLVSPVLTWAISKIATGKYCYYLTFAKDTLIGIPAIFIIIISSIGVFNTCWCWSAVYSRGRSNAFVVLDAEDERVYNLEHIYPAAAGICMAGQLIIYAIMNKIMRAGKILFAITEEEKMERYIEVHEIDEPYIKSKPSAVREMMPKGRGKGKTSFYDDDSDDRMNLILPPPAISPHASPRMEPRMEPRVEGWRSRSVSIGTPYLSTGTGHSSSPSEISTNQPLLGSPALEGRWA